MKFYKKILSAIIIFVTFLFTNVFVLGNLIVPISVYASVNENKASGLKVISVKESDNRLDIKIGIGGSSTQRAAGVNYIQISTYSAGRSKVAATLTMVGGKPRNTSINVNLQRAASGRDYTTIKSTRGFNAGQVTVTGNTNNYTRNWRVKLTGTYMGYELNYTTGGSLFNRRGVKYPTATEVFSRKSCWKPPTNLVKRQMKRSNSFRNNYIAYFNKKYPSTKISWRNYEIHHMRPLQYGGTNSVSNGMALNRTQHKKYTSWWVYY